MSDRTAILLKNLPTHGDLHAEDIHRVLQDISPSSK